MEAPVTVDRLSRRKFLYGAGGLSAAVLLTPEALAGRRGRRRPTLAGGRFDEGVLSGDPTPRGITLWTRLADVEGTGTVEVQVARDRGFRRVVARELVNTTDAGRHYAKARVTGLDPYEQYYYRFATRDEASPVGRFRTALPPDSRQPVRFAFFSCQDYTFGYYNAHALLAEEDVDFVVNLGDYIYAEAYYGANIEAASGTIRSGTPIRSTSIAPSTRSTAATRTCGGCTRASPDLDLGRPRGGGQLRGRRRPDRRAGTGASLQRARRAAAYRAFFECLPTYGARRGSQRIYRGMRFGKRWTCSSSTSANIEAISRATTRRWAPLPRARPAPHFLGAHR